MKKDVMTKFGEIKTSVINAISIPKQYMFNRVVCAIRKRLIKRAAFLRTSNKIIPVIGAIVVLVKVINRSNLSDENMIIYKVLMVVIAIAALITDWYFDYLRLSIRFKNR